MFTLEDVPYQLVKGQQMKELIRETAEPTISLVTDLKEGQCCRLQVSGCVCICLHALLHVHVIRWRLCCISVSQHLACVTCKVSS